MVHNVYPASSSGVWLVSRPLVIVTKAEGCPGFQGRGAKDAGVTKKMTIKNASRHYKATAKRHGFAMPIRVSTYVHVEDGETASVSWLRPSDVLRHLLTKYPALVLGGCAANDAAEAMLETLWAHYERNHPTHHVFMDRNVLRRTIPMCLHGDGARSQKKQPLEVVSIESVLGFNSGDCKDCHFDVCNSTAQPKVHYCKASCHQGVASLDQLQGGRQCDIPGMDTFLLAAAHLSAP